MEDVTQFIAMLIFTRCMKTIALVTQNKIKLGFLVHVFVLFIGEMLQYNFMGGIVRISKVRGIGVCPNQ